MGWNPVAITELPGLVWLDNASIGVSQRGLCKVALAELPGLAWLVRFTMWFASGVEPGCNYRIARYGLAGSCLHICWPMVWNQVAITELPGLAGLGSVYIVGGEWGGTKRRLPNCQVSLGWGRFTLLSASGVKPSGNYRIARFGLAR